MKSRKSEQDDFMISRAVWMVEVGGDPRFVTAYPRRKATAEDGMMKELESAVLTRDLPEHGLVKGDVGTIVTVYAGQKAFEVEFIVADGTTLAVVTLSADDVRPLADSEIHHARDTSTV